MSISNPDVLRLIEPQAYAEHGYPHDVWARLRRESPLAFFEPQGWPAFWAVTKHADIVEISKQPDIFLNEPGMTFVREREEEAVDRQQIRTVIRRSTGSTAPSRATTSRRVRSSGSTG
jgi:hypothetical protein